MGWYNGLPEHRDLDLLTNGEDAGNRSDKAMLHLDVARILLSDVDVLRKTDIADYALEKLATSRIKRVRVVGRRGPLQVSHTGPAIDIPIADPSDIGRIYYQRSP